MRISWRRLGWHLGRKEVAGQHHLQPDQAGSAGGSGQITGGTQPAGFNLEGPQYLYKRLHLRKVGPVDKTTTNSKSTRLVMTTFDARGRSWTTSHLSQRATERERETSQRQRQGHVPTRTSRACLGSIVLAILRYSHPVPTTESIILPRYKPWNSGGSEAADQVFQVASPSQSRLA